MLWEYGMKPQFNFQAHEKESLILMENGVIWKYNSVLQEASYYKHIFSFLSFFPPFCFPVSFLHFPSLSSFLFQ